MASCMNGMQIARVKEELQLSGVWRVNQKQFAVFYAVPRQQVPADQREPRHRVNVGRILQ